MDVLLGTVVEARCDEKLFDNDRFDDLTIVDLDGTRERVQFKHTGDDDRPLSLETFTTDRRSLRLDQLLGAALADRDGPGQDAARAVFRVVLRDQAPTEPSLAAVLKPAPEISAFLPGMLTQRFRFDASALWEQRGTDGKGRPPFAFLFETHSSPSRDDLVWACDRLVIEVGAPPASLDLTDPDAAEQLLLARARADVGAESFPNADRTAVDVAEALVSAARAARRGQLRPDAHELLRRARLTSDFGAVSRAHPVERAIQVARGSVVEQLVDAVSRRADSGGPLLITGPPGHGKSWVCQQLLDVLAEDGWLVAEHYCYLGDADGERLARVLAEAVLGSLLGRLATEDPRLVRDQRPRFAADEEVLGAALRRSLQMEPDRKIALVVDGIDHITRVRARADGAFDPSRSMAETLAALDLPPEVALIVLSQPGGHLAALEQAGAVTVALPGLEPSELHVLAGRLGLVPSGDNTSGATTPVLDEDEDVAAFVDALVERTDGNALYATYLCRETLRSSETRIDPAAVVLELPPFDGTLKSYYDHLYGSLDSGAGWVADIIALVDFPLTRSELREIRPEAAHRIDGALELLAPVLTERATQGGVRIYHESFARYLRTPFQNDVDARAALLELITGWLQAKGLFSDARAFRSLLPLLADAGNDQRVVSLVDPPFVKNAVAAGFAASAIHANLATAVGAAGRLGEWPTIVRYVELSRAADAYQTERFDETLVAYADVPAALLGAGTLAERLLDEDRTVMPARDGLQMCAAVDLLGATPPWRIYMEAHLREAENDNTVYGEASDQAVALAWLRGRLRLAAVHSEPVATSNIADDEENTQPDLAAPVDWSRLAEWVDSMGLPAHEVVAAVLDTHGWDAIHGLVDSLPDPGRLCIAAAETLAARPATPADPMESASDWATAAARHGVPTGSARKLLALGVGPSELGFEDVARERERLLGLTQEVQTASVRAEDGGPIAVWLDACAIAARRDPLGLDAAEAIIAGEGWLPCWLRFAIGLSRADAAEPGLRGRLALGALELLTGDLRPFAGNPRACDLFRLHPVIAETIEHAMAMLDDDQWRSGLRVLGEVSRSITTTLRGELGGPVPPDLVLRLAVDGASPTRCDAAKALVQEEIDRGSGGRYYSDIAEYRLLAARLALAADDRQQAMDLWHEACVFLTAYGWRKDITIYEVLDPFPALIEANPRAARCRLTDLQALCERVPSHTDGSETRHAWSRWWSLLAKADPVGAVHIAVPALLAECNDPNWLLNEALEYVWREWHGHIDPLIAGALRLTLDTPLEEADPRQLKRLAGNSADPAARRLLVWLLARADERPTVYSFSNGSEFLARDDEKVAELNAVAVEGDLPLVVALRGARRSDADTGQSRQRTTKDVAAEVVPGFPSGLPGLVKAIRSWHRRPYDAHTADWDAERFANAIGYRLVGLLSDGRSEDATSALASLASGLRLDERTTILRSLAEGLERHGEMQLAARVYALAWTHTRGHGGWLTFGGETAIDSLARASALDAEMARAVVAEEIERIVATSPGRTYGISQAVIHALTSGALRSPDGPAEDVAFSAWDQAFEVIASRAPRVDASDDPDVPYASPDPDDGEMAPGDLESAMALAVFGGLAHASREKKRRALLAIRLLLEERPAVIAPAVALTLATTTDPATLTWLLCLLDESGSSQTPVLEECQDTFQELARSDLLTVRAIARQMVRSATLALPPSAPLETAAPSGELWTPGEEGDDRETDPPGLDELLDAAAGQRVRRGERLFPGLRPAFRRSAALTLGSDAVRARMGRQLSTFVNRADERWPDAFLASSQAIEETLQRVASGGRATQVVSGHPVAAPIEWEQALASAIVDDPTVPLTLETHRQPRPPLPPPPGVGHEVWEQIREQANGGHQQGVVAGLETNGLLSATLALDPVTSLVAAQGGPYGGWYWLGTFESRTIENRDRNEQVDLIARRYRVAEVRDAGNREQLTSPPVGAGDLRWWRADVEKAAARPVVDISRPLVGIDRDLEMVGDGHAGLGVPSPLLVPLPSLVALLGLRPGPPCSYEDDDGVGLALVTWRAEYDVSDYHLAWPQTHGSGIVIRPDLLAKLAATSGEDRIVVRDFVVGVAGLAR